MRTFVVAPVIACLVGCGSPQNPRLAPNISDRQENPWAGGCQQNFANSVKVLGPWGYPELATGILRVARSAAGLAVVSYNLERGLGEKYLVEVTSPQPRLPDREWQDQNGQSPEPAMFHGEDPWPPGEIAFRKQFGGHAARIVVQDNDTVRRHNFAAAFMPAVEYCVGDHSHMQRQSRVAVQHRVAADRAAPGR
jgi:hypothetical protein